MKKFIIIRGPSGSGKTTIAQEIVADWDKDVKGYTYYEADHFFDGSKGYRFDAKKLGPAHAWCRAQIERSMFHEVDIIVLSNTSMSKWEVEPYLAMAEEYGYETKIFRTPGPWDAELFASRNVHGVPLDTIQKQIKRYESYEDEIEWITKS